MLNSSRQNRSRIILQDRKRLPARFFGDFCKTANGRTG